MTKKNSRQPSQLKILFADDEVSLQELIAAELPRMGHLVTVCPDGITALAALERNSYDCLLVDLDMPGASGIDVIARARETSPDTDAIVLTGKGSTETAIAALRHGAFDYLLKPCKLVELQSLLQRVAAKRDLTRRCHALKMRLARAEGTDEMVGDHRSMQRVRALIEKVAPTRSTVLILGETGTGKELVARAVHNQSDRNDAPFVAVNCGALPENLIESELFGHQKGAFTGADQSRAGLFEVANGGTLFLDEIGEFPKSLQAKLLRVLETDEIRRVGANDSFRVDLRLVCATHRNLAEMVQKGEFREDLLYRINTFEIQLPALRDRIDDIADLARHLMGRYRPDAKNCPRLFDDLALEAMRSHAWPGNIRELANVVEHASIICDEFPVRVEHLPRSFGNRNLVGGKLVTSGMSLKDIEAHAISAALERHQGNKSAAAEELGISLKTLYNKINQGLVQTRAA